MGYTWCSKTNSDTIPEFFAAEFSSLELLEVMVVRLRECYIAYRRPGTNLVQAMVILLDYRPDHWQNFGYNEMDEVENPYYYNCPERILNMLDPLPDEPFYDGARKWRAECRKRLELRKTARTLKHGDTITFSGNPIRFSNGDEHSTFTVVRNGRKLYFRHGFRDYAIRNWREREFVING
jgi:hypothetical protein